jgi:hypothetical protein
VTDPKPAADFLKQIVRQAGRDMARADLHDALDLVLTETQRRHCQVVSFRDGRLLLEVDSAPLFAEFSGFRREDLRQRLNEHLQRKIAALTFRLGGTAHG